MPTLPVINTDDMVIVAQLVDALKIVKICADNIIRRDSNVLKADAAFRFMMNKFQSQESAIAKTLLKSLQKHTTNRQLDIVVRVLKFLRDPSYSETSAAVTKCILQMAERLKFDIDGNIDSVTATKPASCSEVDSNPDVEMNILNFSLSASTSTTLNNNVEFEMEQFINNEFSENVNNRFPMPDTNMAGKD